ncbi:flagellar motor switch protein FliG [Fertoebacter nigrum]|uniref:Flagellar motor switch protein FliG n=1 Tax=Fertoeibacter niger TaxID=2656921 RepID=A0A8X8GYR4_9RHOB|nr:FliG C-terminal domain-containing protein [Fertoeibacter niger]NUB42929.1 flagellar motor switch protein FliG [Fertoeibacter niger]
MAQALAQITPAQRMVAVPAGAAPPPRQLSNREKAAVIVRLLLAEGSSLPLSALPEHMQAALTEQIGLMRLIDRSTLGAVVDEFVTELEQVGLAFPGGIEGALGLMDGHISATAANRLRRLAGASAKADPWDRLTTLPPERLLPVLEQESVEVAAVMLSKLPVPKAADLLGRLPGEKARRVAYAVSMTGNVNPETVRRIGLSLAQQVESQPARAFDTGPVERVGAILNVAGALMREDVLKGLEETDAAFAEQVRRAIFTFAHIPARLATRDVPKVVRLVDQPVMVTALVAAEAVAPATVEFILANMSQRLAQALREEMATRGKPRDKDAEAAMAAVVTAIRQLEAAGEVVLLTEEE